MANGLKDCNAMNFPTLPFAHLFGVLAPKRVVEAATRSRIARATRSPSRATQTPLTAEQRVRAAIEADRIRMKAIVLHGVEIGAIKRAWTLACFTELSADIAIRSLSASLEDDTHRPRRSIYDDFAPPPLYDDSPESIARLIAAAGASAIRPIRT